MVSIKLLLLIVVVACLVQQYAGQTCTASSTITTCTVPVNFYDQAPATMAHAKFAPEWWHVNDFYDWPYNGSCGTANGGNGFSPSDFEFPLWRLQGYTAYASGQYNTKIINGEKNLVGRLCSKADGSDTGCGSIGQDRTPVYNPAYNGGRSPLGQVSSSATFYQFFHAVEQTKQVPYNLTLVQDAKNPKIRRFTAQPFFPLDGLGWNDWNAWIDGTGRRYQHNYAFCMVMNTHFTYSGGEYFYFLGDDDVYAYINNYLVMDLGGVHTALNASILADNLGLTKDVSYRFDFFYCERHTTDSDISFETTINFFCAYTDWCGKCDGDGQSCCGSLCDDGNLCTTDYCDVYTPPPAGCHHNATVCPPSTPCLNSFCSLTTGQCVTTPVNCDDGDSCTIDSCGPSGCQRFPRDCSSTDQCVTTGCSPSTGCTSTPVVCPNNDKCKNSTCDSKVGCVSVTKPCNSPDACNTASCTATGGCVVTPKPACNDGNVCTQDSCDPIKGCVFSPRLITDVCNNPNAKNDSCTQYSCDPVKGCVISSTKCVAPDACTSVYCNVTTGCTYSYKTCSGDACNTATCNKVTGNCDKTPKAACAKQSCFIGSCDPVLGCLYTAKNCSSNGTCWQPGCSNDVCTNTRVNGDSPYGTAAVCGTCGPYNCNNTDPCNPQICTSSLTCATQPVNCDDKNLCTTDKCTAVGGKAQCVNTPIVCNAGTGCSPQSCDPSSGRCVFNNQTCDDGNPCTVDSCVSTSATAFTCRFDPIICSSSDNFCHPQQCLNGVCVNASLPDCTDGNPCTYDICSNGTCSNPLVCQDSGTLCNPIVCLNGSCVATPVNCSSGNLCSIDACDPNTGSCTHTPKNCGGTICNPSTCDLTTGACVVPDLLDCNDKNPCTNDTRLCTESSGFFCNNTDLSYTCDDNTVCTLDYCNSTSDSATTLGACFHTNVTCTAPTVCTIVVGCDAKNGCQYAPKICPTPADWCKVAVCDEVAGCITVDRACAPDDNYCYQGFCNNATRSCSQQQRPNWETITNQAGVTCLLAYNKKVAGALSAGIIAAIVIAAVIAAALIAIAGKKGVDVFLASRAAPIGAASNNPLYADAPGSGTNALYNK